jgi:alanine racemase
MKNRIRVEYKNIAENARRISMYSGKKIFAVVKNNAYNLGLAKVVETLLGCGVSHFAVTVSEEAVFIKRRFPEAYVLQLNPADEEEIRFARECGAALAVTDESWLRECAPLLEGIELHMEINVGMNRFGISGLVEAERAAGFCAERGLLLTGLYTHFPQAEEADLAPHGRQIDAFRRFHEKLSPLCDFRYIHGENTAAILLRDPRLGFCNFVRPGVMLYGYSSRERVDWLLPSLYVHTEVIGLRELPKGGNLGYGTGFEAERDMKIAVLPIGYGDGLTRARGNMPVFVKGKERRIIGKIFMSHTFIEADDGVEIGDEVEIYGERVRIDDLSSRGIITNSEQMSSLHVHRFV